MTELLDLRAADRALTAAVLALNAADAEATSPLDAAALARLVGMSALALAASRGEGFVIALDEAAPYDNPNHGWFRARYRRFLYVDRVVVAAEARGRGLARALYAAVFAKARATVRPIVGCEINLQPPNPASDAFHAALGFAEIGRAALWGGSKTVRYVARAIWETA
jgi:predicted GNAT superfamily acetyltransferase